MATGTATLDFGATPADVAQVDVTGQSSIASDSHVEAFFQADSTADNGVDEHQEAAALCELVCGNIVASDRFTIYAHCLAMMGIGQFKVHWVWA